MTQPPDPRFRVTCLASGSQGNATVVEWGGSRLLIDAGLRYDELEQRMTAAEIDPDSISGIFVTHRHKDHIRGVTDFARKYRTPIRCARSTSGAIGSEAQRRVRRIVPLEPFDVGRLTCRAIPVQHDAPNTMALLVEAGPFRYGHATDLGCGWGGIRDYLTHCHVLLLEFNHDVEMLESGDDPPHLKRRIRAPTGHLSNAQAAEILRDLADRELQTVICAHLSQRNNTEELALSAARDVLVERGRDARVVAARQQQPLVVDAMI